MAGLTGPQKLAFEDSLAEAFEEERTSAVTQIMEFVKTQDLGYVRDLDGGDEWPVADELAHKIRDLKLKPVPPIEGEKPKPTPPPCRVVREGDHNVVRRGPLAGKEEIGGGWGKCGTCGTTRYAAQFEPHPEPCDVAFAPEGCNRWTHISGKEA